MSITNKNLRAFGLDISDSSVKIALLERTGKIIRPRSLAAKIFPRNIVAKDSIREPEKLAEIIKQTVKETKPHSINTPYVIASLPESKSFVRVFDLPPMKKSEVDEAVRWEAEQHIPLAANQVEMDWKILNGEEKKEKKKLFGKKEEAGSRSYRILLTASPKDTIGPIVNVLKMADLQPVALEIESFSTARSCLSEKMQAKGVLVVDIGTNRTGFSIINKGIIEFTSSLAYAGLDVSKNIIKQTGYSFAEAEKAKIENGLDKEKQDPRVLMAMEESLGKIVQEIKNTVRYFIEDNRQVQNTGKIDQILMCGGTARMSGLVSYFSQHIDIPIQLANPWVNIYDPQSKNLPPISKKDSLSFNTVIGLALRGLDFSI